ncbi:FAD-binding oxidoreductase [Flammeovirga kamogawensis]|uniref:2Fe-2S iron-sulfur cluster binding domain-containing protein n=1 Tax=Flammeovirga kamogawensis TaxID=373891 RepID=A0ABX8GXX4_9BACT|nr:FAD-binding oxidoreductase [Flammeovirga kamogawensis]MBB6458889.1 CDP-4-dehydro-6-deoxyglucose reductase [Flammeovirga kamogawensis]QWG08470.1 2Fe-2S iron-sulfur cluster binding domain-containing protein [Flammeovirga kamogawensis]TRX66766.1 2Fe-2S iron-sulfur cluster binding domain-containing protein [Flammeovirga kamogawensis]
MYIITLKNNKSFICDKNETIFDAAKKNNIYLEHSCLKARCSACKVKVLDGQTIQIEDDLILTDSERKEGYILSCNTKALSDISLDIEDLGDIELYESKVVPTKINKIEQLTKDVIKVILRLPPTANFQFNAGQYINLIKGTTKRSYSIAEILNDKSLVFYIKNYKGGEMSQYWFNEAKPNDLLRMEGPLGSFFYRPKEIIKELIFLGTGTGIAPINAILQYFDKNPELIQNKSVNVYFGARHEEDLFWSNSFNTIDITFTPVLSKPQGNWPGEKGYVQNSLLQDISNLKEAQVFACGSDQMIQDAKVLLLENGLEESNFYADAFICTN